MKQSLEGRIIAVSISENPDLPGLGLGEEHLTEAMFEFARHLMLLGATVAYGGDLRPGGFTENLLTLANRMPERDAPLVRCYLAWPLHLDLTQARKDALLNIVEFLELPEATRQVDATTPLPPKDVEAKLVWARNLTAMRQRMAADCDARIILGGKLTGALGVMPGVLEEALTTMDAKKPLYVLGGFGGASGAVWNAVNGRQVKELSIEAQEQASQGYADLVAAYNAWAADEPGQRTVDYAAIARELKQAGTAGLRTKLTEDQLQRLATTLHGPEMVRLVLGDLQAQLG